MKIPICLITGFLGAGKTTLLKHIADKHKNERLLYLINDFSPQDIDGILLTETDKDTGRTVLSIPGGSIFCKCLVTEFIGALTKIPEEYPDIKGVIIEVSGMANPKIIETMLQETALDRIYELSNIVSVIDPGSFYKLRFTLPNIIAQIESADMVIINKVDLHPAKLLDDTRDALKEINSSAVLRECSYGDVDFNLFDNNEIRGLKGEYALCKDPDYETRTVYFSKDAELDDLVEKINKLKPVLYRAKGFVPIAGETWYFDYSAAGLVYNKTTTKPERYALVVIHQGKISEEMKELIDALCYGYGGL